MKKNMLIFCFLLLTAGLNAAVSVLSATPFGRVEGTSATDSILVTFNQPMVALEKLPEGDGTGPLKLSPDIKGKFRWQGTSTLSFTPSEPLPFSTLFSAEIKAGFKSEVSGEMLAEDYSWKFETLRPQLLNSRPYNGEDWQGLDTRVLLIFNQPMDAKKASGMIKMNEVNLVVLKSPVKCKVYAPGKNDLEYLKKNFYIAESELAMEKLLFVEPTSPLKKDRYYDIELQKGLQAKGGDLGMAEQREVRFGTYKTFKFIRPADWNGFEPTRSLEFQFSNPVKYSDFFRNLEIEPKLEINADEKDNNDFCYCNGGNQSCPISLSADFKAGTEYKVTIKGGLKDKFGQKLGGDIKTTFRTTDFAPRMNMPTGMGVIESYVKEPAQPLSAVNINHIQLKMALIEPDAIVPFIKNGVERAEVPEKPVVDRLWTLNAKKNDRVLYPIKLDEVLGGKKSGFVYINADLMTGRQNSSSALIQVTSMAITGKFSTDGMLIYVSGLKDAGPIAGCDIELRDNDNKVLWTGKTDRNGFANTPGWEELKVVPQDRESKPRFWVIAKKDGDTAFSSSDWGTGIYPYDFNISYDDRPKFPRYGGQIFTERGIYRPGENVFIKGILREKRQGKWELPRIKEYQLTVKDSRNADVLKKEIKLSDDFGSFDQKVELGKLFPTGYYRIQLWEKGADSVRKNTGGEGEDEGEDEGYGYDNGSKIKIYSGFRVEEYKAATFEVSAGLDHTEYIMGDKALAKFNGRYLFGAPMNDMPVDYTLRLDNGYFEPEGYPGYIFGSGWLDDDRYMSPPGIISSGKTKLDRDGNFSVTGQLNAQNSFQTLTLVSEGVVTSPDRQRLAGRKTAIVHAGEFYIGLKPQTSFVDKGKEIDVEMLTVQPDGKLAENRKVEGKLIRREWNSVRKSGVGGRLEWISEKKDTIVKSFNFVSSKKPYEFRNRPDKSGYYILDMSATDSRGNRLRSGTYFYVTGEDYTAWERTDDDKIEIIADKTKYKSGETAKILVKSPYEKARAVVTLEREGIIDRWLTEVKGSTDTIRIPIKNEYLPNVYVCVMLYQGRTDKKSLNAENVDPGRPSFKIGYTNLPVDPGNKKLTVAVATDKKSYKPGEKVNITMELKDADGKGAESEVSLAVVDLGVLSLINYQTPDAFPYFYGSSPLSVDTTENRINIIGQRNFGEKGENRGGGGGMSTAGIDMRTNFVPTAYWDPSIKSDAIGRAVASFTLPDNLTTFKVMAAAATKDSKFGGGDNRFTVAKPLLLKPSMPRFALVGDTFDGGVLVHNNTADDAKVMVMVRPKNVSITGKDTQEILIEKNSAKEVRFSFETGAVGTAEFEFFARMGNESDGLKWTIPVKIPRPSETVATYSSTEGNAKEGIKIPSDIYDAASKIDISLASTALIGLKGGLEYLFDYPYGCLEQKTSKMLPLIVGADFIDMFGLAPLKEHTAKELIEGYISTLGSFQTGSGGFSYWTSSGVPSPYLTAYVLWAIAEMKKSGYTVDDKIVNPAIAYMKAFLHGENFGFAWPYSIDEDLCTKAFAVYSLSANGAGEQGYINDLYKKMDQMPLFGKVYLLKALNLEKMPRAMIVDVETQLLNKIKMEPTQAHFEESDNRDMDWIWNSNVRTTAAILQGILEVEGKMTNAEKVAHWLASARKSGRWMTTQENIYVLSAYSRYVKCYENDDPDFTAKVSLDGKQVAEEIFKGRLLTAKGAALGVDGYSRDTLLPLTLDKSGAGRLYYELRMIYAPKDELPARSEGMTVTKSIKNMKTGEPVNGSFTMGEKYIITLKVNSPQERKFVAVDDPLPAGLEVIDLTMNTESESDAAAMLEKTKGGKYRWWGSFDHWENYDDRVLLFAEDMERGEHTYSYLVQATTPGTFLMPATKAEEMYTPEVFGRTEQKNVIIK
jgi:uncharacterized protein YfaS (alpha-2-macroglobulin family)